MRWPRGPRCPGRSRAAGGWRSTSRLATRGGDAAAAGARGRPRTRPDRLHLGHHRPAQGGGAARGARSPPTSTRWPRLGSGPNATSSSTACRCSTCTGSCSGSSARSGAADAAALGPFSPGRVAAAIAAAARCCSASRRCTGAGRRGAGRPGAGAALARPGCWCRARRRCRPPARAAERADRPASRRALRDDRDADEHRHPGGRRAAPGNGRAAAAGRRDAADRRRRPALEASTTRRSARSRSAGRTCSSGTSTAPTRPRRRCATVGLHRRHGHTLRRSNCMYFVVRAACPTRSGHGSRRRRDRLDRRDGLDGQDTLPSCLSCLSCPSCPQLTSHGVDRSSSRRMFSPRMFFTSCSE